MRYVRPVGVSLYFLFAALAIYVHWHPGLFSPSKVLPAGKYVFWLAWIGFTAFSMYCTAQEDLFATIRKINQFHWGRQVVMDLYIGLSIFLFVVYLHQGSWLVLALWFLPALAFVNLTTLFYVALHYDSLVAKFVSPN